MVCGVMPILTMKEPVGIGSTAAKRPEVFSSEANNNIVISFLVGKAIFISEVRLKFYRIKEILTQREYSFLKFASFLVVIFGSSTKKTVKLLFINLAITATNKTFRDFKLR